MYTCKTKFHNSNVYAIKCLELSHDQQMQLRQVKYLNDIADAFHKPNKHNQLKKLILDGQGEKLLVKIRTDTEPCS